MTFLVPMGCFVGSFVVITIFNGIAMAASSMVLALLGGLIGLVGMLAGTVLTFLTMIKLVNEVKSVTNNAAFAWWWALVPVYNVYWMVLLVPQEVANAKRMVGAQEPVRSPVLYFFLFLYALASDVNDLAARTR